MMPNVEFVSSCSSKLLEAPGHWLLNLAPSCEAPFAPSFNSSCCWSIAPLGPSKSSFCSWLVVLLVPNWQLLLLLVSNSSCSLAMVVLGHGLTLLAFGLQLFLIMVKAPFAPSLQLLLLLIYSSF
jgi:hypothetical protein